MTLVERLSRYVILPKVANKQTDNGASALSKQARALPRELCRSLACDCGRELGHRLGR